MARIVSNDQTHVQGPGHRSEDEVVDGDLLISMLDQKRKHLDHQVEQFRALKDQEFRAFEHWVRHRARKSDVLHEKEGKSFTRGSTVASSRQFKYDTQSQDKSSQDLAPFSAPISSGLKGLEPVWPPRAKNSDEDNGQVDPSLTKAFYGTDGFDEMVEEEKQRESNRDRERDFQGVFTPSYLPLLTGASPTSLSTTGEASASDGGPSEAGSSETSATILDDRTAGALSSSADDIRPSLLTAQNLSSSCPDHSENNGLHRRSSSAGARSDTSIGSRRSSFKDPKTPRSPKRVMFDIDDMVVSPSTSPLLEKQKSSSRARKAAFDGTEKFEIVKNKKHGSRKAGGKSKSTDREKSKESSSSLAAGLASNGNHILNSTTAPQQPLLFLDDYEKVSLQDDMFTFDEDLTANEQTDEAEKGDEPNLDMEAENDDKGKEAVLTSSSPHAGSLPIEIQWPGRRY